MSEKLEFTNDKPIKVTVSYVKDSNEPCSQINIKTIKAKDIIIKNGSGKVLHAKKTDTDGVFTIENI